MFFACFPLVIGEKEKALFCLIPDSIWNPKRREEKRKEKKRKELKGAEAEKKAESRCVLGLKLRRRL